MNARFINAMKEAGVTGYRLSKRSGIPYTTISELTTGKKDINRRSVETVFKLASALGCEPVAIMNPTYVMDGVSGTYRNAKYCWRRKEEHMLLEVDYSGENYLIETPYRFCDCSKRQRYDYATELYIDAFIKAKQFSNETEEIIKRRAL